MTYGYYEYRLRELNELLFLLGDTETEEKQELLRERDEILTILKEDF